MPSSDELSAGVERLEAFGYLNVVVGLVESKGQTVEYWLNKASLDVYTILLLDFEKSEIQKRLQEIRANDTLKS